MKTNKLKLTAILAATLLSSSLSFAGVAEDDAITEKAKAKLLLKGDSSENIEMTTKNSEVFLKGKFNTSAQVYKAIEDAASLEGVTDVDYTALLIEGDINTDSLISAKVKGKITQLSNANKISSGHSLVVETNNREVHIYGTVSNNSDTDTIKNAVKKLKGVDEVRTDIQLKK